MATVEGVIMDNRDWLILHTLYDKKNITQTAKSLFISQPALTKRLQLMEKEFETKIVNRESRGIQFTPEGEYLAKCSEEMLTKYEKIKENISNMNSEVRGTLKLGVSISFTKYKLPRILKLFKDQYPNVEFKVITAWSSNVFNLIYNKDVHIGFVRGDFSWMGQKRLLSEENICIVSKDKINIADLPKLPRVVYKTDYMLKSIIDNWWTENYTDPPMVSIELDQADSCKEMVVNGLGYGIIPSALINDLKDIYKFNLADKEGNALLRRTWMLYHEEDLKMNVIKAFVNFIDSINM